MRVKIRKMDHTGDSVMATYETNDIDSIKVAQAELENFLSDCISKYSDCPPVWVKRCNETAFSQLKIDDGKVNEDMSTFTDVLTQIPLVAG